MGNIIIGLLVGLVTYPIVKALIAKVTKDVKDD